jgi:hypothetical protein
MVHLLSGRSDERATEGEPLLRKREEKRYRQRSRPPAQMRARLFLFVFDNGLSHVRATTAIGTTHDFLRKSYSSDRQQAAHKTASAYISTPSLARKTFERRYAAFCKNQLFSYFLHAFLIFSCYRAGLNFPETFPGTYNEPTPHKGV